jgi:anti-sigma factor ChrR (cupin superfamily)
MLACNEVSRAVAGDLRNESWRRRVAIRLHLLMCDQCRRFAAELTAINRAVRALPAPPADPAVAEQSERVLRRLHTNRDLPQPPEG